MTTHTTIAIVRTADIQWTAHFATSTVFTAQGCRITYLGVRFNALTRRSKRAWRAYSLKSSSLIHSSRIHSHSLRHCYNSSRLDKGFQDYIVHYYLENVTGLVSPHWTCLGDHRYRRVKYL